MLHIDRFSNKYSVRRIIGNDVKQVVELCKENTLHSSDYTIIVAQRDL